MTKEFFGLKVALNPLDGNQTVVAFATGEKAGLCIDPVEWIVDIEIGSGVVIEDVPMTIFNNRYNNACIFIDGGDSLPEEFSGIINLDILSKIRFFVKSLVKDESTVS